MATTEQHTADEAGRAELRGAVQHLRRTERGRESLDVLRRWLCDGDGLGLSVDNQGAVYTILFHAWGRLAGSAIDAIRESTEPAPIAAELGPEHDLGYFADAENGRYDLGRLQYSPQRRHLAGCNGRQLAVAPLDAGDEPFQIDASAVHAGEVEQRERCGGFRRLRIEQRDDRLVLISATPDGPVERVAGGPEGMGKWPGYERMGPFQPGWVSVATLCLGIEQLGHLIDYARSVPGAAEGELSLAIGGLRWGMMGDEIVWLLRDQNGNAVDAGLLMPMHNSDPRGTTMKAVQILRGERPLTPNP
jgi:hypothetical protein